MEPTQMVNNVMDLRLLMLILENLWPNKQSICNLPSPHVIGKAQTQRANHLAMGPHKSPMRKGVQFHDTFHGEGESAQYHCIPMFLLFVFFLKEQIDPLWGPIGMN